MRKGIMGSCEDNNKFVFFERFFFYSRLLSLKDWLKTKPNFELCILAGSLIGVKTIGEHLFYKC